MGLARSLWCRRVLRRFEPVIGTYRGDLRLDLIFGRGLRTSLGRIVPVDETDDAEEEESSSAMELIGSETQGS